MTATIPTREQVEQLKHDWRRDPCFDIETTDGFERYADELRVYREEYEREIEQVRRERLELKATTLGVPGNTALAEYVLGLEIRIQHLEERGASSL